MSAVGPLLTLVGVVVGAALSYLFGYLGEGRRERWALNREWRERRIDAYAAYISNIRRMRDIAQQIAADVGLDDQSPRLHRDVGLGLLAEANTDRGRSCERLVFMADAPLVDAARHLNRAAWRLEWFARGLLDDTDSEGWRIALREYYQAIHLFHARARQELGMTGDLASRDLERSPRELYEAEKRGRHGQLPSGQSDPN